MRNNKILEQLKLRYKELKELGDITQDKIALKTGLMQTAVSKMLQGSMEIKTEQLLKLCDGLRMELVLKPIEESGVIRDERVEYGEIIEVKVRVNRRDIKYLQMAVRVLEADQGAGETLKSIIGQLSEKVEMVKKLVPWDVARDGERRVG